MTTNDPQAKYRVWMREQFEALPHGSKSKLAKLLNVSPNAVTRMMNTEPGKEVRQIEAHELQILSQFFGSPAPDIEEIFIPIDGLAGAGPDGTVLFSTGDGDFGEVALPRGASGKTHALEVRGDSMYGVANDGWIIFYEDREPPREHHLGELCVCWLEDGRVLVKIPFRGRSEGLFDLESANAPTMRDVSVTAFSIVTDIKTRPGAKKFLRRSRVENTLDVTLDGRIV